MKKIGITGGIGSGKSTICKVFEVLSVPVYYADIRAKALMEEDPELVQQISDLFGYGMYEEGKLQRQKLAEIVFKDPQKLNQLNSLVHPAVFRDNEKWMAAHADANYVIKEAALIFESGSYKNLDAVITVFAPEVLRIQRVLKRDDTTESAIKDRISKQMPEEEKISKSDFVIYNDEKQLVLPQVLEIHRKFQN